MLFFNARACPLLTRDACVEAARRRRAAAPRCRAARDDDARAITTTAATLPERVYSRAM